MVDFIPDVFKQLKVLPKVL